MSILDYKNIEKIRESSFEVIKVETISSEDVGLLKVVDIPIDSSVALKDIIIELSIYEEVTLIKYIPNVSSFIIANNTTVTSAATKSLSDFFSLIAGTSSATGHIEFKLDDFVKMYFSNLYGNLKLSFNFLKKIASDENFGDLILYKLSSSRNECRIKYTKNLDFDFNESLLYLENIDLSINQSLYVNFKDDNVFSILNILIEDPTSIVIRLYDPLPDGLDDKLSCYLCEKLINSYVISITKNIPDILSTVATSLSANMNVNLPLASSTQFSGLTELLNGTPGGFVISMSLDELKIDYSIYSNFIFYSSAEKRLNNFVYKLQKIEDYESDQRNNLLLNDNNAIKNSTSLLLTSNINEVKGNFTLYEKYLYYESSSYYTSSYGEFFASTWPKPSISSSVFPITGSKSIAWYNSQILTASLYDRKNLNYLRKTVPLFIQEDTDNDDYLTFVDMVGEFFDEQYLYIKKISDRNINKLKNTNGMSNMIASSLIDQLGSSLITSFGSNASASSATISEFFFNYDLNGNFITGSKSSLSIKDQQNVIYKRFLNNLIYVLKTKGTAENIKVMANMFGLSEAGNSDNENQGYTLEST